MSKPFHKDAEGRCTERSKQTYIGTERYRETTQTSEAVHIHTYFNNYHTLSLICIYIHTQTQIQTQSQTQTQTQTQTYI
jgi:hypothetical protein